MMNLVENKFFNFPTSKCHRIIPIGLVNFQLPTNHPQGHMSKKDLILVTQETKLQLEEQNKQLEQFVINREENDVSSRQDELDDSRKKKLNAIKKEKKITAIGAGVFLGVCLLTPPFGWAIGAGALTGALTGHVINKGIDKIEKAQKKKKGGVQVRKEKTNDDVVWGEK